MKPEDIFERLDPPAGGLARLREKLDARPSNVRYLAFAGAVAAAAAILFFLTWPRTPDLVSAARAQGGVDDVALGLAPPSRSVAVVDTKTAGSEIVTTSDANVVFVWISSTQ
jgi:hypothetical protein